ncbi:hypothetical protein GJ496_009980 [Pomphorhynchus laevis]|nr:hypothetical protein GJ496_009980 [Pomphorhynchus laevis]
MIKRKKYIEPHWKRDGLSVSVERISTSSRHIDYVNFVSRALSSASILVLTLLHTNDEEDVLIKVEDSTSSFIRQRHHVDVISIVSKFIGNYIEDFVINRKSNSFQKQIPEDKSFADDSKTAMLIDIDYQAQANTALCHQTNSQAKMLQHTKSVHSKEISNLSDVDDGSGEIGDTLMQLKQSFSSIFGSNDYE